MLLTKSMMVICLLAACFVAATNEQGHAQSPAKEGVHAFSMKTNSGDDKSLGDYQGKVLLVVNTASRCGFTRQLGSMEKLYQQYKDRGFEILAFPANNFMGQEPGTDEEIKNFCLLKYNTSFPLFAKISVKGKDINPLYQYLTEATDFKGPISWNFNKFLVDKEGNVVARYPSKVDPLDEKIINDIESFLK